MTKTFFIGKCGIMKKASCYCQSIKFQFESEPFANFMCHCSICRKMHGSIANHILMFPLSSFQITEGEDLTFGYSTSNNINRFSCSICGSSIFNKIHFPNETSIVSSFPSLFTQGLKEEEKIPQFHIFYADRIMNYNDNKLKYKDVSKEFQGSGILLNDEGKEL